MDESTDGAVRRGEVLTLEQRSGRRRDYRLRRGDRDLGRLGFAPGRRSLAQAETDQTGALVLTAGRGRVGQADLLGVTAAQGLLRSWVQITVQHDLPEPVAVLLSLIGGFLALGELQAEVDTSAAVGGIVAASAG